MGTKIIGLLLIIAGIVLGVYVGGWVLFVGGLVQFFTAIKVLLIGGVVALDVMAIVFGIVKVMFAGLVGVLIFWFCTFIGGAMMAS